MKQDGFKKNILFEDNHLLIVNKENGKLVQGDITKDLALADEAKAYIKIKYNKPGDIFLGIPHRLDRPVSGVLVFSKTSKSLIRMNKLFQERNIQKTYWAISKSRPPYFEGDLINWIKKNHETNRVTTYNKETKGALKAISSFKLLSRIGSYYLLEIKPKTGRPHQIRAQLSKFGCPILGDLKYGGEKNQDSMSIFLHSKSLCFNHPVKLNKMNIEGKPPSNQIWDLFNN